MIFFVPFMFFKAFRNKSDLYQLHDPELLVVGLLLKFLGRKVIYDIHENYSKQVYIKNYIPKVLKPLISKVIQIIENFSVKTFDGIISPTPEIKKKFSRLNKNNLLFRNFPDINIINNAKPLKINKKIYTIIYPGALTKLRGVSDIINIAGLYNGRVKLILAGNWESDYFQKYCMSLDGWKYVKFLGKVKLETVYRYMKSSNLGVHLIYDTSNYRQAYPTKVFEYMACSLPILISNLKINKSLFAGCSMFVKSGDLNDIKSKIDFLIKNKKISEQLGKKGKVDVIKNYNLDLEVVKLNSFYENILNNRA